MPIETGAQVTVFDRNRVPNNHQETQMVNGLRSAWTLPNSEVVYAHPERFSQGALQEMFKRGDAEGVLLHDNDSVLGWLALVHHTTAGNVEIGSVNAASGNGVGLVEETYRQAADIPFLFFDTATCRTGMEQAAKKAAGQDRIVIPTYVDPNVWGDKNKGIDWGCVGYFAISTKYINDQGPIRLPQLPENVNFDDGTDGIVSDVMTIAEVEGEAHEMRVFGDREEREMHTPRPIRALTEGLVAVDYMDVESRKGLGKAGYKPCGIEMGLIDDSVVMDVHYSPFVISESKFGKNGELHVESHPNRTNVATTAAFIETVRTRRMDTALTPGAEVAVVA